MNNIVMAAHVLGLNYGKEIANMERVVNNGGYIIDCMGEGDSR